MLVEKIVSIVVLRAIRYATADNHMIFCIFTFVVQAITGKNLIFYLIRNKRTSVAKYAPRNQPYYLIENVQNKVIRLIRFVYLPDIMAVSLKSKVLIPQFSIPILQNFALDVNSVLHFGQNIFYHSLPIITKPVL